ncbi:MAG: hypothetical protein VW397_02920, partial [Candidatus Margulisiibacteriota bacterium]
MNQSCHDPFQPLQQFLELVEAKCNELPNDIEHWNQMANKHDLESRTHLNIIQSSVRPRESYLNELLKVKAHIHQAMDIIEQKDVAALPEINLEMPFETILRKYTEFTKEVSVIAEDSHSFSDFFKGLMDRIGYIRTELAQAILRCSKGEINLKEIEHQFKVLEPELESVIEEKVLEKKGSLSALTEQLIQKIELDVSIRQAIQDRH